jgi:hypothetical protein
MGRCHPLFLALGRRDFWILRCEMLHFFLQLHRNFGKGRSVLYGRTPALADDQRHSLRPRRKDFGSVSPATDPIDDHLFGVQGKGRLQCQNVPHDHGPAIDIGLEIVGLATYVFGGHVSDRPRAPGHFVQIVLHALVLPELLGQTEIKEFQDSFVVESNVVGFLNRARNAFFGNK